MWPHPILDFQKLYTNTPSGIHTHTQPAQRLQRGLLVQQPLGNPPSAYNSPSYSSMAEPTPRADKLRKLERFRRRLPHISARGLTAVLDEVEREGVPDSHSRRDLREARNLEVEAPTPYGKLLHTVELHSVDGGTIPLRVVHPLAFLRKLFATCVGSAMLVNSAMARTPCTPEHPWNLIFYSDEVTPGDALVHDNRRKIQVIYFSFLEFGPSALAREDSWMCVCAKRSSEVNKISGGMSQIFGAILLLLFGATGTNIALGGLVLNRCGQPLVRLYAQLRVFVQDGGAHKITWHCKGDGGSKLCFICKNLFTQKCELVDEDDSGLLVCNVIRDEELDMATDQEILDTVRDLAARKETDTAGEFKKREQITGFVYEPHSMLLDRRLDGIIFPVSQFMHDWMHCLFANGVFNIMLYLVLESFLNAGCRDIYDRVERHVKSYRWPSRVHSAALSSVFSLKGKKSSRKAKHVKCQASDGLSLVPVLAIFFGCVALSWDLCDAECYVFLAFADVVDYISAVPRGGVDPDMLRTAVCKFLYLFANTFGFDYMIPKFHWLLHFGSHLLNFGTLISCFVHERKHRMVKRYCNEILNTEEFEYSVLSEVVCHHLNNLDCEAVFDFSVGLVAPRVAPRALRNFIKDTFDLGEYNNVRSASEARINALATCKRGDVVLVTDGGFDTFVAGQVWYHVEIDGVTATILSLWALVNKNTDHCTAEWLTSDEPMIILTDDIMDVVVWTSLENGNVMTLLPQHLR